MFGPLTLSKVEMFPNITKTISYVLLSHNFIIERIIFWQILFEMQRFWPVDNFTQASEQKESWDAFVKFKQSYSQF